jgi:hypothetical protein
VSIRGGVVSAVSVRNFTIIDLDYIAVHKYVPQNFIYSYGDFLYLHRASSPIGYTSCMSSQNIKLDTTGVHWIRYVASSHPISYFPIRP